MKHILSLVLMFLLLNNSSSAQTFVDVAASAGFSVLSNSTGWGNGVSFFDVDEDGWDDLTVCVAGYPTRFYRNNMGSFELHSVFFNDQESKSCIWLDIDEDGDNDLFVSRFNAAHQVFLNNGDLIFEDVSFEYSNLFVNNGFAWGVSFGDYSRDGYLDVCIGNYGVNGASNTLAQNLGTGLFALPNVPSMANVSKTSFQPVWIDLNKDLFQDLYVINDHNQGNEFYVQTSPGYFEDFSSESGLIAPASAMSNSWCDFDRDGDFDVYITNTIQGNRFLVNNGANVFTDEAQSEGMVLNAWTWNALWLDAENDGWEDLYIASEDLVNPMPTNNFFFKNNHGNFESQLNNGLAGLYYGGYASAKGDLNNDGNTDVVLGTEVNVKYKLYQNVNPSNNNYFKFRLRGRLSNRNGVGTRYEYWVSGEKRVGYTYCGEGYLSQNSQNVILGLGNALQIDSMKLFWISGVEDVYFNLPANTFQVLVEGETLPGIEASKYEICPTQDSVTLSISHWPFVVWDDGSTETQRVVFSPGIYSAQVSTGYGHAIELTVEIIEHAQPQVICNVVHPSCYNSSDGQISIQWQTQSVTHSLTQNNNLAGNYYFEIPFGVGCVQNFFVDLINPVELNVLVSAEQALCSNSSTGSIFVSATGGTLPYDFGIGNAYQISNVPAGNYSGVVIDANGCEGSWNVTIDEPSLLLITAVEEMPSSWNEGSIVLTVDGGVGNYTYDWSNGNLTAENLNLQPGDYAITVTDGNGCSVDTTFSLIFNFVNSLNRNTMNWTLHKDGLHYEGSETLHHVFVYDALGRLLHREQVLAGHSCLPVESRGPVFILSHEGNWKSSISLE